MVDVESQQREAEEQFNKAWEGSELAEEWQDSKQAKAAAGVDGEGSGIWCAACKYLTRVSFLSFLTRVHTYDRRPEDVLEANGV